MPEILRIQRLIPAPPERVFDAWTDPGEMKQWWGPKGVKCLSTDIDLKIGGKYRIGNELPDGSVLWISGEYEEIDRPNLLVFTWLVESACPTTERVSVRFEKHSEGTKISLTHELIGSIDLRDKHQAGWMGCMDGLRHYLHNQPAQAVP